MRPIVSFNSSPTYNLAKHLNFWFRTTTNYHSRFSIKNSVELIEKISLLDISPNAILVSFDVSGLFPNTPLPPTLKRITNILSQAQIHNEIIKEFMDLLTLCLLPNFCKFHKFYVASDGVPMGSPFAPIVSEVFMDLFEQRIFDASNNNNFTQYITYWHRYVDDILCLWTGSLSQLQEFHKVLNSQFPAIKFTVEVGGDKINYLDLSISIHNGRHQFEIFRKPTFTDITIQGDSYCPLTYKFAAFYSMIHRLLSVPLSSTSFQEEVNIIKHLAYVNHVNLDIDNVIRKKRYPYDRGNF